MAKANQKQKIPLERWETFLRILGNHLALADEAHLSMRCWKPTHLLDEISALTRANRSDLLTNFPPAKIVVEHLQRMGWLQSIKVQSGPQSKFEEFHRLEMQAGGNQAIHPLELLQAYLPQGVICYLSALTHHELTTQFASHHHIARLMAPKTRPGNSSLPPVKSDTEKVPVIRNPLGTELFRFDEIPYHLNKRDSSLVPGIQLRVLSPRCWLRVTTLEQTLLDSLMQPNRCGGPAIILEAWETGIGQLDPDRLADYLHRIQHEELDRRVGSVLSMLGADFKSTALDERLRKVQANLDRPDVPAITLLPGYEFPELNTAWKVRIP